MFPELLNEQLSLNNTNKELLGADLIWSLA